MKKTVAAILFFVSGYITLYGQCSDAGVCSFEMEHSFSKTNNNYISLNYSYGTSGKPDNLKFSSVKLSSGINLFQNLDLAISLPFNIIDGPLGKVNGIGDMIVSLNHRININNQSSLLVSGGVKLATGKVNENNLPQAYQAGLGTNDILLGINYNIEKFTFGVGYQISSGRSENNYSRLKRGDDFLIRAGYSNIIMNNYNVGLDLLIIKRLKNSSVLDVTSNSINKTYIDLANSSQLQINVLGKISKSISDRITLNGELALPLINRDVNVDGLKRSFSIGIGAAFHF